MPSTTAKPVHSLVIDAGNIIKNEPPVSTLIAQSEALYTIPAVIGEIKDASTRARVETTLLPFLTQRQPRSASVKIISDFARKTGDLEVLSRTDIQLMALSYELECERNGGDWRLRSVPGQKRVNGAPPKSVEETAAAVENGSEAIVKDLTSGPVAAATDVEEPSSKPVLETRGAWGTTIPSMANPQSNAEQAPIVEIPNKQMAAMSVSTPQSPVVDPVAVDEDQSQQDVEEVAASESEDSDDGEGWITPSNIKRVQAEEAATAGSASPQSVAQTMQVATLTTDFAMQNVLLRMNLNLLSPSLNRISQVKTWVLRCHACFSITKDMTKQFCPRCGGPSLLRTSCSTDKDGNFKVHLKQNMQWNTRGNVFSIPKPVAGTSNGKNVQGGGKGGWGQSLILAEDQKEYIAAMTGQRRRKDKDLMDEDYLPGILSGDRDRAGGRPKVGGGKNVNSRKRH